MRKLMVLTLAAMLTLTACSDSTDTTTDSVEETQEGASMAENTIVINDENEEESHRVVTLNEDTDMPNEENLYKIPAGTYKVTTDYGKVASFSVVKDDPVVVEDSDYPEELDYVIMPMKITGNSDDFPTIDTEVEITIAEDESLSIPLPVKLTLELQ